MAQSKKKIQSAPKAQFSFRRHIVPPLLGIIMMGSVFAILNAQWITAQLQYKFVSRDPINYDLLISSRAPTDQPEIIIPKIGVTAPVIYDEQGTDAAAVAAALHKGTYHYPTTAYPGQNGNVAIFGHSSGAVWVKNQYKFIFTLLDKLEAGDKIIVDYKGIRFIYEVTDKIIVPPTEMSVLDPTADPTLSLITCTPVGTNKNRLAIHAKQISPKLEANLPAQTVQLPDSTKTLPKD